MYSCKFPTLGPHTCLIFARDIFNRAASFRATQKVVRDFLLHLVRRQLTIKMFMPSDPWLFLCLDKGLGLATCLSQPNSLTEHMHFPQFSHRPHDHILVSLTKSLTNSLNFSDGNYPSPWPITLFISPTLLCGIDCIL